MIQTTKGERKAFRLQNPKKEKRWLVSNSKILTATRVSSMLWGIVRAVIIIGLCYIIIYPFLIKLMNAFKGYSDFIDPTVRFIPKAFTLDNIIRAVQKMNYREALWNTALMSVILALIQTAISSAVGYGFARFKFKGNQILFFFVILTLIVPPQTIIVPLFMRFRFFLGFINLIDTPYPMLIMALTGLGLKNGLYIFMFRQFFRNMPKELEEAAYIDGYGSFATFFKIMLPSATAIITTIFLLSFSWQWTDTLYNGLFFKNHLVLPNAIHFVATGEVPIMAATLTGVAALLAVLPLAVIYIFAQRLFVESVERSGIVG